MPARRRARPIRPNVTVTSAKQASGCYFAQFARRKPPTRQNSLSLFVTRHSPLERA